MDTRHTWNNDPMQTTKSKVRWSWTIVTMSTSSTRVLVTEYTAQWRNQDFLWRGCPVNYTILYFLIATYYLLLEFWHSPQFTIIQLAFSNLNIDLKIIYVSKYSANIVFIYSANIVCKDLETIHIITIIINYFLQ